MAVHEVSLILDDGPNLLVSQLFGESNHAGARRSGYHSSLIMVGAIWL